MWMIAAVWLGSALILVQAMLRAPVVDTFD